MLTLFIFNFSCSLLEIIFSLSKIPIGHFRRVREKFESASHDPLIFIWLSASLQHFLTVSKLSNYRQQQQKVNIRLARNKIK
jgi:hypothetical protein